MEQEKAIFKIGEKYFHRTYCNIKEDHEITITTRTKTMVAYLLNGSPKPHRAKIRYDSATEWIYVSDPKVTSRFEASSIC